MWRVVNARRKMSKSEIKPCWEHRSEKLSSSFLKVRDMTRHTRILSQDDPRRARSSDAGEGLAKNIRSGFLKKRSSWDAVLDAPNPHAKNLEARAV